MTKKDYALIAKCINVPVSNLSEFESIDDYKASYVLSGIVDLLCIELGKENPKFNADRFKEACGV